MIQVVLFDDRVGPDALHQLVLRQQPAGVLHQHAQRVEDLRAQRHGAPVLEQPAFADFEAKRPEFVGRAGAVGISESFQKTFRVAKGRRDRSRA